MAEQMKFQEFAAMVNSDIWTVEDKLPEYSCFVLPWPGNQYVCFVNFIFQDWGK